MAHYNIVLLIYLLTYLPQNHNISMLQLLTCYRIIQEYLLQMHIKIQYFIFFASPTNTTTVRHNCPKLSVKTGKYVEQVFIECE